MSAEFVTQMPKTDTKRTPEGVPFMCLLSLAISGVLLRRIFLGGLSELRTVLEDHRQEHKEQSRRECDGYARVEFNG